MKCLRHILLPNVHNFRDMGGYPAADEKMTKWGILFRTDSLSELTNEGWAGLRGLGVGCIIDLRSARERDETPVKPQYQLKYLPFSLMGDAQFGPAPVSQVRDVSPGAGKDENGDEEFLRSTRLDYTSTLFTNISCAVDILDSILTILESGKTGIAYMCSAGKDRTGIISAVLLYLCGVPDEDIIADYMVSNIYNTNGVNKRIRELIKDYTGREPDEKFIHSGMASDPQTMRELLSSFREKDLIKVLGENGFGEEKQKRLAELMTQ